ncbi:UBX domain-containing protein 1 [Denticeps clupeoides]|uniref:UBX domain-containing protein 1 n=1 Tax=Denticeps clupeoides TaxID=299321 RepID=UPI0010A43699|nr:UBX domain-containing protein 1-like [Denticeps clupeoides]
MAECTTLESLLEMGFDRNRAEKAVAHTGNQGIERAMDWLMEHENDPDIDEPYVPPVGNTQGSAEPSSESPELAVGETDPTTEPDDSKQPMTDEEKKEQVKRLEELMRVKQEERRERERKDEIEREKQRRRQGQELLQVKQKMQDDEMKKLADQRQREKMEDRLAKQRVREKIARDREERAQKFGGGSSSSPTSPPSEPTPPSPSSQGPPPAKKDYDECRIQVRLLDGSALSAVFKAQEPLAAVRVFVQMNGADGEDFNLMTPYPRRVYSELDMEKPLRELGVYSKQNDLTN